MSTVQVMFGRTPATRIPVMSAGFSSSEIVTSSATTAATTIAAEQGDEVVMITNTGGNVYISAGAAPTAVANATSILILDGERVSFAVNVGDKIAVIDA